jgi:hypothetical protein
MSVQLKGQPALRPARCPLHSELPIQASNPPSFSKTATNPLELPIDIPALLIQYRAMLGGTQKTNSSSPMDAKETKLYGRIEDLMKTRGYAVIPQFKMFSPLTSGRRNLDLLGFRWTDDGDLDAWAIEAKQGELPANTLTALGQAIEYQLYVPHVSVAAEVSHENLTFADPPLRQLGLGYIHATPTSATEIIIPSMSPRLYQNEFNHVIRHAGVLCLLGRERWRKEDRREHHFADQTTDARDYAGYGIHTNDPVQYMLIARGDSKKVQLVIWIERKPVLIDLHRQIDAGRLVDSIGQSGATTTIFKYQRDNFGRLGKCLDLQQLTDRTAIEKALEWLKEDRVCPVMSVALDLWDWDAMPRRAEATKAVEQAIDRLKPTRAYLADTAKHGRKRG